MPEKSKPKSGGKVITDARFAAVHYDPRFQRFPKARGKIEVDERFAGMFNDPAFQVRSAVDKRGRKVKSSKEGDDMRRYYRLKGEEGWAQRSGAQDDVAAGDAEPGARQAHKRAGAVDARRARGSSGQATAGRTGAEGGSDIEDEEREGRAAAVLEVAAASRESDEDGADEGGEVDSEVDSDEARARERWARARGLAGPEASSSDEEAEPAADDSGTDSDEDAEVFRQRGGRRPSARELEEEEAAAEAAERALRAEWGVGALAANPREEVPLLPEATRRLACVDLDWEHVRAVDIYAALRSFLPSGGAIDRVTVYPSDYGLERMAEEATAGPQGIFRSGQHRAAAGIAGGQGREPESGSGALGGDGAAAAANALANGGDGDDDDDGDDNDDDDDAGGGGGGGGDVDPDRLRTYERSKLRWYYAIVDCDSARSASALYDECDGMELMKTACRFDLRFVPDAQSFEGRAVRDEADSVPQDYVPPVFQTRALQHTNVELTWDQGDEGRKRMLTRKLTAEEIKDDDFRAYLASEDDEGSNGSDEEGTGGRTVGGDAGNGQPKEEDAAAIRERYRRLLLGGAVPSERRGRKDWADGGGGQPDGSDGEDEGGGGEAGRGDREMEMEVTFVPGLEGLGERLLAKKRDKAARAGETVWEAYLRRKREKKAAAKRLGRTNVDSGDDSGSDPQAASGGEGEREPLPAGVAEDPFFQHDDDPFDDPFFRSGGDAGGAAGHSEEEGRGRKRAGAAREAGGTGKKGQEQGRGKGAGRRASAEEEEEDRRRRAELEMLMLDEGALLARGKAAAAGGAAAAGAGPGGAKVSKKERMRERKERRRRERQAGSDEDEHEAAAGTGFAVNLEDPRFRGLLVSPDFALDPTDPRFAKAGPGAASLAAEVARRRSKGQPGGVAAAAPPVADAARRAAPPVGRADLKLQVASLKRKVAAKAASAGGANEGKRKVKKGSA